MSFYNKIFSIIKSKNKTLDYKYFKNLRLEQYPKALAKWYYSVTGEKLDLNNPKTFNEKMQWLKLYDSTPVKTRLADKYLVRDWVKEKIGGKYLIPLIGVWDNFDDINFDKLPNQFVLKCNHGSGMNIIAKDKFALNIDDTRKKINKWMNTNYAFTCGLELHYKDIKPRIIAEKYMEAEDGELKDYKFLCFNGHVELIWVDSERYSNHKRNIYNVNGDLLPIKINDKYENFEPCPKPKSLEKMIEFAEKLSQGFSVVRVDFYNSNGNVYFGEMTFTSTSGIRKIEPKEFDLKLGQMIKLPKIMP